MNEAKAFRIAQFYVQRASSVEAQWDAGERYREERNKFYKRLAPALPSPSQRELDALRLLVMSYE